MSADPCGSNWYADTGRPREPGDRLIACDRPAGHKTPHAELTDGLVSVEWPNIQPGNTRPAADIVRKIVAERDARHLAEAVRQLTARVAGLEARLPRPGICGNESPPLFIDGSPLLCVLDHGHRSEWHEDEGGARWTQRASWAQVEQLIAERDEARAGVNRLAPEAANLQLERDAMRPVVDAARTLAEVERTRSAATEDSSIWLEGHKAALAGLVAAVDAAEVRGD